MTNDTFGARMKRLREEQGLTQNELRERMLLLCSQPVGQSYLSELERREQTPTVKVAKAIATALGTSVDYLAMLTDDPSPRIPEPV